jgi:hypothetical protein
VPLETVGVRHPHDGGACVFRQPHRRTAHAGAELEYPLARAQIGLLGEVSEHRFLGLIQAAAGPLDGRVAVPPHVSVVVRLIRVCRVVDHEFAIRDGCSLTVVVVEVADSLFLGRNQLRARHGTFLCIDPAG